MKAFDHRFPRAMLACLFVVGLLAVPLSAQDADQEEHEESAAGVAGRGGAVTANLLNVRARPATHYEVIAKFKLGDRVQVVGENEEWYRVLVPAAARAYVAVRYIGPDGVCTGDRVRIHSGPGLAFNPYGYVNKGDRLKLLGAPEREWQKIEPPPGTAAWVSKAYVRLDPPPVSETPVAVAAVNVSGKEPEAADLSQDGQPNEPEVDRVATPALETEPPKAGGTDSAKSDAAVPAGAAATGAAQGAAVTAPPASATAEPPGTPGAAPAAAPVPLPVAQGRPFGRSGLLLREGVVVALPPGSQQVVTHFLGIRILSTTYPVCYLRSSRVNLSEWECREVRVYGTDVQYPNWSRPVMDVRSIHLFAQPTNGGMGTRLP
jgi:SH3-like domain-containing protein